MLRLNRLRPFTCFALLAGCLLAIPVLAELTQERITIQGVERQYLLQLPSKASSEPRSLLILLHGHGGSAGQLVGLNDRTAPFKPWLQIAQQDNAVLMSADGVVGPDGKQGWNDLRGVAGNPSIDDLAFVRALIELARAEYGVGQKRTYLVGISNGGHMALRVALQAPEQVAGIGVVAAAMPQNLKLPAPKGPISVAFMNGTKDRLMPFAGGKMVKDRGVVLSTQESTAYWARANGCEMPPETKRYENLSRRDRSRVLRSLYTGCASGAQVALFEVRGAGHSTPSRTERYRRGYLLLTGRQNWDIESAQEIWAVIQ